nr:ATP-binding protein [Fredinandcohnia onubensis]
MKSAESEERTYKCSKCKDTQLIMYRVHHKTKWVEDSRFETKVPESMVTEDDFYAGKVCSPEDSWEWRDTYSKRCDCVVTRKLEKLMKSSQITEEFRKLGFQNFRREGKPQIIVDAYECALEYFREFKTISGDRKNSIALLGQPGAGKTHLLMAISNNLLNKYQIPVQYFPYVEGMDDLRDDFDLLEQKLNRMKKVNVLFIDDLFKPVNVQTKMGPLKKPQASEWELKQMYAVINYRYLNHLPILVSCELTIDELVEVDEALGTRIFQMCEDFIVVLKGDRKLLNHRLEGLLHV